MPEGVGWLTKFGLLLLGGIVGALGGAGVFTVIGVLLLPPAIPVLFLLGLLLGGAAGLRLGRRVGDWAFRKS